MSGELKPELKITAQITGSGPRGIQGEPGYTPIKGIDYHDGTKGDDGHTPTKGVDYFDGLPGSDGYTPVKGVDYFDGTPGTDGHTPVKGVDYFTAAEKTELLAPLTGEINTARKGKSTLGEKINEIDTQLAEKAKITDVNNQIASVASGSPKGVYATLSLLQTAYPTGNTNIYVVSADGKWYYWNGSAWTAGGVYQSTGIADDSITPEKTSYINSNVLYENNNLSYVVSTYSHWVTQTIDFTSGLSQGDVITFSIDSVTNNADARYAGVAVYDSSNNVLVSKVLENGINSLFFTMPVNAVKLSLMFYLARDTYLAAGTTVSYANVQLISGYKKSYIMSNDIVLGSNIMNLYDHRYNCLDLSSFDAGMIKYQNGVLDSTSGVYHKTISVLAGDTYKISGYSYLGIMPIVLTDDTNNVIDYYPKTETAQPTFYHDVITIPKRVTKMHINYLWANSGTRQYFISGYKADGLKIAKATSKLTIIGDSLSSAYQAASSRYLNLLEANDGYIVENLSRDGHGFMRDDDSLYAFWRQAQKVSSDTDIALIFGSFNDMPNVNAYLGTIADTGTATICGCINQTIANLYTAKNDIKIGIVTPTPWSNYYPGMANPESYINAIIAIAKNKGIPYLDLFHCSNLRPWDSTFNAMYFNNADGTHPNNEGHRKFIYPKMRSFAEDLKG